MFFVIDRYFVFDMHYNFSRIRKKLYDKVKLNIKIIVPQNKTIYMLGGFWL